MRCVVTVPHNPNLCDDECLGLCDKMEFGAIRYFEYNDHEYVVFIPLCRAPIISRDASNVLQQAINAMQWEINCRIITKDEVREIIQEFDEYIDVNKTQFSEYHDRKRLLEVKPVYSSGLANCPYQLFARRDVMLWIHQCISLHEIKKRYGPDRPINYEECEVCNQYVPSHTLEIVKARTMISPYKDTWASCPKCRKEVIPREKEERISFDINEANSILKRLTPKDREILECHDQQRRDHAAIQTVKRQFQNLKCLLNENNLEALKLLAEELKPPPTSPA